MLIAAITEAELEAVVALWERCGLTRPWNDPRADIALARRSSGAEVLVGQIDDRLVATVMVGCDGHRGCVYYLAVDPEARLNGLGRRMMAAAEDWLRSRGAPKIQLMVREDERRRRRLLRVVSASRPEAPPALREMASRRTENDAPVNFVDSRDLNGARIRRRGFILGETRVADGNITKDSMYDAVAPDDFESMLNLDRYGQRTDAFDKIISATHDHFWDPLDKKYIDFDEPWDMHDPAPGRRGH